jgi:hypothetical protein
MVVNASTMSIQIIYGLLLFGCSVFTERRTPNTTCSELSP